MYPAADISKDSAYRKVLSTPFFVRIFFAFTLCRFPKSVERTEDIIPVTKDFLKILFYFLVNFCCFCISIRIVFIIAIRSTPSFVSLRFFWERQRRHVPARHNMCFATESFDAFMSIRIPEIIGIRLMLSERVISSRCTAYWRKQPRNTSIIWFPGNGLMFWRRSRQYIRPKRKSPDEAVGHTAASGEAVRIKTKITLCKFKSKSGPKRQRDSIKKKRYTGSELLGGLLVGDDHLDTASISAVSRATGHRVRKYIYET